MRDRVFLVAFAFAGAGSAWTSGCTAGCEGVGCGADFDGASITVFNGGSLPKVGTVSATGGFLDVEGTVESGPGWDLLLVDDGVLVGSPTDGRVRSYSTLVTGATEPDGAEGSISGERGTDRFGSALARAPGMSVEGAADLVVGAPHVDREDASRDDGAFYVFRDGATRFEGELSSAGQAAIRVTGANDGGSLGQVVAGCADMDGDGRGEAVASAPFDNTGADLAGGVVVLTSAELDSLGSRATSDQLAHRWLGTGTGAAAGTALDCAHDLNGDGRADLLVGAPFSDANHEAGGVVYMISDLGEGLPAAGLLSERAILTFEGTDADAWFGWSVVTGDLDADGFADLAISAPGFDRARGLVLIYDGRALSQAGFAQPVFRVRGLRAGDGLGRALAMGDYDGDGFQDLFMGAPRRNPDPGNGGSYNAGEVFVFRGTLEFAGWRNNMNADDADLRLSEPKQFLRAGQRIQLFDTNADGRDELGLTFLTDPL